MINIAIIDDNRFYIEDAKRLLTKSDRAAEFKIFEYSDAHQFVKKMDDVRFDIIFLDIVLKNSSGIELGGLINERCPDTNIIFMSAHEGYFKDVYRVTHSYFLTKEFEEERFIDAVERAIRNIRRSTVTLQTKNERYDVVLEDIIYLEGYQKHTTVFMSDGKMHEYSISLREIEPMLSKNMFIRTHQSFIINMHHIKSYSRQEICTRLDYKIPISRTYINQVREKITLFLGGVL